MSDTHDSCLSEPEQLAARFGNLSRFDHVILAVSGGSDSIALLRLVGLWMDRARSELPEVSVITIDHGLRKEAAEEATFVGDVSSKLGLQHRTLAWGGDKPKTGLQEAAREARYELLINAASRFQGNKVILTAHTQDDQAETVLMRLARGSGPDGLAAIPKQTVRGGVVIMRPLLDTSRKQLRAFLNGLGQTWREDPSNDLTEFERIRIRNAQSARNDLNLTDKALAQTAHRMERARSSLERVARDMLQRAVQRQALLSFGVFQWPVESFGQYGSEIGVRCLRRIIHVLGGSALKPNLSQTEALYAQVSEPGFRGATLHGARLMRIGDDNAGRLFIFRETGRAGLDELILEADNRVVWDNRFPIVTAAQLAEGFAVRALRQDDLTDLDSSALDEIPAEIRREALLTLPAISRSGSLYCVPHLQGHCSDVEIDMSQISARLTE